MRTVVIGMFLCVVSTTVQGGGASGRTPAQEEAEIRHLQATGTSTAEHASSPMPSLEQAIKTYNIKAFERLLQGADKKQINQVYQIIIEKLAREGALNREKTIQLLQEVLFYSPFLQIKLENTDSLHYLFEKADDETLALALPLLVVGGGFQYEDTFKNFITDAILKNKLKSASILIALVEAPTYLSRFLEVQKKVMDNERRSSAQREKAKILYTNGHNLQKYMEQPASKEHLTQSKEQMQKFKRRKKERRINDLIRRGSFDTATGIGLDDYAFVQLINTIAATKKVDEEMLKALEKLQKYFEEPIVDGKLALFKIIDNLDLSQARALYELFFKTMRSASLSKQKSIVLHAYAKGKLDTAAFLLSLLNPLVRTRLKRSNPDILTALEKYEKEKMLESKAIVAHGQMLQELRPHRAVPPLSALPGAAPSVVHLKEWFGKKGENKTVDELIEMMVDEYYMPSSVAVSTGTDLTKVKSKHFAILPEERDMYIKLLKQVVKDEQAASGYYCFYHAHSDQVKLIYDIQKAMQEWFALHEGDYVALRLKKAQFNKLDDFIQHWDQYFISNPVQMLKKGTTVQDYWEFKDLDLQPVWKNYESGLDEYLISVNLALFGNTNDIGKGSVYYALRTEPTLQQLYLVDTLLYKYNFPISYAQKFKDLFNRYMKPERGAFLIKICIPQDVVDQFVYLAHPWGTPYRIKINDNYDSNLKRHKTVSSVLNTYRTNPRAFDHLRTKDEITPLNWLEARIVMIPPYFEALDRIKFKTYGFVSEANKKAYQKGLKKLVNQMITDWIKTGSYKSVIRSEDIGRLGKLVSLIEQGQKEIEQRRQQVEQESERQRTLKKKALSGHQEGDLE